MLFLAPACCYTIVNQQTSWIGPHPTFEMCRWVWGFSWPTPIRYACLPFGDFNLFSQLRACSAGVPFSGSLEKLDLPQFAPGSFPLSSNEDLWTLTCAAQAAAASTANQNLKDIFYSISCSCSKTYVILTRLTDVEQNLTFWMLEIQKCVVDTIWASSLTPHRSTEAVWPTLLTNNSHTKIR